MTQEIKIEKKASEVIQPGSLQEARTAIRSKQDLSGANLHGLNFKNLSASGAVLRKTDLTEAVLAHCFLVSPNFYRAKLNKTAMHNTVLLYPDLVKTSFKGADLHESVIVGADAQEASFEDANLRKANLLNIDLQNTNFTNADLTNARLASCDVTGADFTNADLTGAKAYNIDWSQTKVPPATLPEPIVQLPRWTWSVIIGGILGGIALLIYALTREKSTDHEENS